MDTVSPLTTFGAAVAEVAMGADTPNANTQTQSIVIETAVSTDATAARYFWDTIPTNQNASWSNTNTTQNASWTNIVNKDET